MSLNIFKLEEYLTQYEFNLPYLLCCSDAESFTMAEVLSQANREEQALWADLSLKYTEPFGHPLLRKTIAQTMYQSMHDENILCFAGAEEGIYCALYALCEPGDHVIVFTPCYQSLKEIPRIRGCEVSTIDLKEENAWRISLDEIKKNIRSNTKCVVMNFPHNPTGQVLSQEDLTELVTLLDDYGIWLFSDEVYRELGTPSQHWASPAADSYNKALSLGVMSKSFGMAGLRVGWIAGQNKPILHAIKRIKDYVSICNSAPSEILSLIALRHKDYFLNRNNQIVSKNLALLDQFFLKFTDRFRWVRPEGGCIGFVNYLHDESTDSLCERLAKKHGILLMPASIYECNSNHFRIGFGRRNMPEVLALFESAIT